MRRAAALLLCLVGISACKQPHSGVSGAAVPVPGAREYTSVHVYRVRGDVTGFLFLRREGKVNRAGGGIGGDTIDNWYEVDGHRHSIRYTIASKTLRVDETEHQMSDGDILLATLSSSGLDVTDVFISGRQYKIYEGDQHAQVEKILHELIRDHDELREGLAGFSARRL